MCCCASDEAEHTSSPEKAHSSIQDPSCLTIKVVGGLNEINAAGSTDGHEKILSINSSPLPAVPEPLSAPVLTSFFPKTDAVGPPEEDIYILTRSLLI